MPRKVPGFQLRGVVALRGGTETRKQGSKDKRAAAVPLISLLNRQNFLHPT
jgi:hypothetical protein